MSTYIPPMKLLIPTLAGAAVLAGGAAAATGPASIRPGYWETTSQIVSPFPTSKTEKRCIRPEDVEKVIAGSPNHNYTCTYPTKEIGAGKIKLAGSCKTKHDDPVPISTHGTYTADSLRMDAYVKAKIAGLTVPVHARTTARRIGDTCPEETASK
jgi:hypothetical protein